MRRYSLAAIALHWLIAALLGFQISVGWALEGLGARGFALYQLHKSIGLTILMLTLVRIGVRWWKPRPPKLEQGWQGALASVVHVGLYAFMLGAPLTGWALVSTAKVQVPTLIYGILPLRHLPLPAAMHDLAAYGHGLLAWFGIGLFLLHVGGALRHHLLLRDGLLWRMVPGHSKILLVALPALILAGLALGKIILPTSHASSAPVTRMAATESRKEEVHRPVLVPRDEVVPDIVTVNASDAAPAEKPLEPPPAWTVQPGGRIGFSVSNGSETISGRFAKWSAKIVMDPVHPDSANIRVTIDVGSASVGDNYMDGMLPGDEFFGVATYPTATFVARGAETVGANSYRTTGTLTLKGVSHPQRVRFTLSGDGATRKITGSATIARAPFGVGNGASSADLAPNVAVSFDFTARQSE